MFGKPLALVHQTVNAWKDMLTADIKVVENVHPFGHERFMAGGLNGVRVTLYGERDLSCAKINRCLSLRGLDVKLTQLVIGVPSHVKHARFS